MLGSFIGFLQADAYAGYDQLYATGRITEVACWAHFRRKTVDLHKSMATPLTTDILARIAALYAIEADVRGQPPDARRQARQERTRPLIEALREVLDKALRQLSPKSEMAKAIAYGTKRWAASTPKPISPTPSQKSPQTGPHRNGTNSCRGTGGKANKRRS